MHLSALSPFALLAVLAASPVFAQLTFTPAGQATINDQAANSPVVFALAAVPKGNVDVYFEAPNFSFDKCKVTFTPANWNQPQTIQATPQPIFGDFNPKVEMKVKTSAKHAEDKGIDGKDIVYNLVRSAAAAGMCQVFADPHFYTFDQQKFDIHNDVLDCMNMVWSNNLIVQIKTVRHDANIALVREMAFRYNGAVVVFKADQACSRAVEQAVIDKAGIKIGVVGNPNTNGFSGTFTLSDGTIITATNSMVAAADGKWCMNVNIQVPCYFRKQDPQGLCGNFNGNPADDLLGPDKKTSFPLKPSKVWLPDASDLGKAWVCKPDANLFECPGKCTNFPKGDPVPDAKACSIAKGLQADTPAGYDTKSTLPGYDATPPAPPKPAPPPAIDPEIIKKAEELCNKIFAQDDCKDKFVSQDDFRKQCLTDAKVLQNLAAADGIKTKYMEALDGYTKPIGQDPKHPRNKEAFDCRKKLGLGMNECLNNCSGDKQGACIAGGCKCKDGFSGDDCSTVLPPAVAVAAAIKDPGPAAKCDGGDLDNYDGFNPVSYDKCWTITGDPGIFDDDSDVKKTANTDTKIKVCSDRAAKQTGTYCIFMDGKMGAHLNCTGDDSANDNKYGSTCVAGYSDNGACYPKSASEPTGVGKCAAKSKGFDDAKKFDTPPCDQFKSVTIPANEKRFFCIGAKGMHLLQCPENVIKLCDAGCVGKFENLGKPGEKPCGKAACAKGAKKDGYT